MAVLSHDEIIKLLDSKTLQIAPLNENQIGPGSVDLRLGYIFRVFKKINKVVTVDDNTNYKDLTEEITTKKGENFLIQPGELVHAVTIEKVSLPSNISARIDGRSRFARLGLLTHVSSGFMQPGTSGKIVLEMANLSPIALAIKPNTKICQIVFEELKGSAKYSGKFKDQSRP
ncbi:MAG: deoxycytidine triphosphate deaminase [Candidatus Parvarchaeum acidiphilum ARMAN-4]|uniref:Deoxycytidine triphosphate deaminase n=1 Tax=Candidatus Parvarchaeum acidiphilum ARMAN-4 TaxID=662760 RepID=D2EEB7_PARA4|nr:MAG: deoxycytidine triphosphate deaminase [Candidatus Parvarchaeum acidiphilum ARMAN-4]